MSDPAVPGPNADCPACFHDIRKVDGGMYHRCTHQAGCVAKVPEFLKRDAETILKAITDPAVPPGAPPLSPEVVPATAAATSATDPVQRPAHYARFAIEPIYFIMTNNLSFAQGNVIKYLCRFDAKDGVQDLKKAKRYLEMMIKQAEGDPKFAD